MRIRGLTPYIHVNHLEKSVLENCDVVIDGVNFFYTTYKDSRCTTLTGGEYDKFASHVREKMKYFLSNEVKCHIIFKGGRPFDLQQRTKQFEKDVKCNIEINEESLKSPVLTKNVIRQVLDELGIKYVVTKNSSKQDLVDLAIALDCPVISFDKEFFFYPVDYIPFNEIIFENGKINCKVFYLEKFLQNEQISKDALAIFGAMLNLEYFEEGFYRKYVRVPKFMPKSNNSINVIKTLLATLKNEAEKFRQNFLADIDDKQQKKFWEALMYANNHIFYKGERTFLVDYFLTGKIKFDQNDPLWLAKGMCLGHIKIFYVDLVENHTLCGSWDVEDFNAKDALEMSLEIIRYAYDLLTNYDGSNFTFICRDGTCTKEVEITKALSIPKPDIFTDDLFKSGWSDFTPLFDAFLKNIPLDLATLKEIPESAHILMITLVYFSRRSPDSTSFAYSVLLSYILLDICSRRGVGQNERGPGPSKECSPTEEDRVTAAAVTAEYFSASDSELVTKLDRKTLHPLIQFQHCLIHMNNLNALCSAKYTNTIYHKTFNGTFIYNMMERLEKEPDPLSFFENLLRNSPTVFSCFSKLFFFYGRLLNMKVNHVSKE